MSVECSLQPRSTLGPPLTEADAPVDGCAAGRVDVDGQGVDLRGSQGENRSEEDSEAHAEVNSKGEDGEAMLRRSGREA